MTEKDLKKIYERFLSFDQVRFFVDVEKYSTSLKKIKVSRKVLKEFYDNYYRVSFIGFFSNVKDIIYSQNVFGFITKNSSEDWKLWPYLNFLEKEKIITVQSNGRIRVLKKDILRVIPKPQNELEIKARIEKKLKVKVQERKPVTTLFNKFKHFIVKGKWDQMPISQGSAIFVVKKILANLPLNKKFLFVGDDDFVSIILSLADPSIECLVIDADEQLLDCINFLALKFNLPIETRKVDIRKQKDLGEKFIGFLTNPIYTEAGIKTFLKYGINQLGKDGGAVFLEVGDESIGNRFLFLQDFFAKNNLVINELTRGEIFYPYIELYEEDKEILRRLTSMGIDKKIIENSPKLAASLYVFQHIPFKPKKIRLKKPIYAYL